ncbi:MAG: hypothetical protein J6A69_01400 [Clostridia bacterium]|nr:hypothetical protein [Clostridia bacterium]
MKKLLCAIVFCIFVLCGCSGAKELEELAYVIAIGIDEGENDKLNVTFVTAIPSNISSESGNGKPVSCITVESENVLSASVSAGGKMNRNIDFSHCRLIAFNENIAIKGLGKFKKTLLNEKSFRPDTLISVIKGKTSDFFNNSSSAFETNPAKYFELMFGSQGSKNAVSCTIKDFSGGNQSILPLADKEGVNSCVIINNDRLAAVLPENKVAIYKLLSGKKFQSYMDFENDEAVLFISREKAPEIKVDTKNNLKVTVTLYLNGELIAENKKLSHNKYTENIKAQCENFLEYTSKELKCDILNITRLTRPHFFTVSDYEKYNPTKKYERAEFDVKIVYSDLKTGERNLKL